LDRATDHLHIVLRVLTTEISSSATAAGTRPRSRTAPLYASAGAVIEVIVADDIEP
jgi:hypothetical protein